MEVTNTKEYDKVASMFMLVYGSGGVGKTTFAATFPKPLLIDFENGAKYFGQRGIEVPVAQMKSWFTREDIEQLKGMMDEYETIIIDPVGEAMEKLLKAPHLNNSKHRQADGSLTRAGWGKVKDDYRWLIKFLRDSGKNVVLVGHAMEDKDDTTVIKRPKISANMGDEVCTMVDVVAYMEVVHVDGEDKRVLRTQPSEKYYAKDRTGTLPAIVKPEYEYIRALIAGEDPLAKKAPAKKTTKKKAAKKTENEDS